MARKPQTITVVDEVVKEPKDVKKNDTQEIKIGGEVIISESLAKNLEKVKSMPRAEEGEVKIVEAVHECKEVKMVKIKLAVDHRCHIGGEWYSFKANKQYNVPEQVKAILMQRSGLLLPL